MYRVLNENIAFSIGGESNPSLITKDHWQALANECGVNTKYVQRLVIQSAKALLSKLKETKEDFNEQFGEYRALDRIEQVVTTQCRRALK